MEITCEDDDDVLNDLGLVNSNLEDDFQQLSVYRQKLIKAQIQDIEVNSYINDKYNNDDIEDNYHVADDHFDDNDNFISNPSNFLINDLESNDLNNYMLQTIEQVQ